MARKPARSIDKAIFYFIMIVVTLGLLMVTKASPVIHIYEDGSAVIGVGLCLPGGICNEGE